MAEIAVYLALIVAFVGLGFVVLLAVYAGLVLLERTRRRLTKVDRSVSEWWHEGTRS